MQKDNCLAKNLTASLPSCNKGNPASFKGVRP
jgi:hypothetical protein